MAARDLRAAIEAPPAVPAREQHALVERLKAALAVIGAEAARAARDGRVEAVRQRRRPGRADRARPRRCGRSTARRPSRRGWHTEVTPPSPKTSRRPRTSCTRSRNAGSRSPKRRARRRRRCGTATVRPPTRFRPRRASSSRSAPRSASANLKLKMALIERAEALADSTDWIKTADELKKLQAEWQAGRPGPAAGHQGHLEALPRRVRPVLHPPQRRPGAAQGSLVRQPREEGSALRPRRRARRLARLGEGGVGDPPAAGRLEDDRPGAPHQVRGDLAALPHRLRHVLRPLQAPRRDRARSQAGRSRGARRRSSKRWRRLR